MFSFEAVKRYKDFTVDVSFKSGDGLITGLFGESGSGKSSIINMFAGLVQPDCGKVSVGDRVLFDSEKRINIAARNRNAGYIFQEGRLFPHMTVLSNLKYGMKGGEQMVSLEEVVALLGIENLLQRRPHKLSGGEKQRVAIGRAILSSPDFMLMDEPLSALDKQRKKELIPFILKMVKNFRIPTLYVTHSTEELEALCDNVINL